MSKRGGGELNHENWDQEDEREEAGRFQAASAEQMKGRVIKTARRRKIGGDSVNDGEKKNAFSSFGGFSAKTDASAAFSFLSKPAAAPESKTDKPAAGAFVFGSAAGGEPPKPSFGFGEAASTVANAGAAAKSSFSFGSPKSQTSDSKPVSGGFAFGATATSSTTPAFGSFGATATTTNTPASTTSTAPVFGGFGAATASTTTPAFGTASTTTPAFGAGSTAAPAFGTSTTPLFGSFGATSATSSAPAPVFGAKSPSSPPPAASGFSFGAKSPESKVADPPPIKASSAPAPIKPDFGAFKPSNDSIQSESAPEPAASSSFSFGAASTESSFKPAPSGFSFGSSDASKNNKEISDKSEKPAAATGGFSFGSKPESSKSSASLFSFGAKAENKDDESKSVSISKSPASNSNNSGSNSGPSKEYLSHIKALNLQVLAWLKMHIEKDPLVILSPVFKDYDEHLEDINKQFRDKKSDDKVSKESEKTDKDSAAKPTETKPVFGLGNPVASETKSTPSPSASAFSFGPASTAVTKPVGTAAPTSTFSFGASSQAAATTASSSSTFSFGAASTAPGQSFGSGFATGGFSFGAGGFGSSSSTTTATAASEENKEEGEDEDTPPVVEVKQVEESDAIYSKKCKLFYKKDGSYVEKGVGMLYLKSVDGGKIQLLIRADTNLGNVLLNILLSPSIPTTRVGKNNVMLVCVPNPPVDPKSDSSEPCPMLLRVKTTEDADELKEKLDECKEK